MFKYSRNLLFGDSDLLEFKRSSANGIARLWTQKEIPLSDHRYWSKYLRAFDSSTDVFSLIGVADVRRALVSAPENISTLVELLVLHLESLRDDPLLSPLPKSEGGGSASNFLKSPSSLKFNVPSIPGLGNGNKQDAREPEAARDREKELLNCCRILTRLLPVVMEGDHDAECTIEADGGIDSNVSLASDEFEHALLWKHKTEDKEPQRASLLSGPQAKATRLEEEAGQFVIDDADDVDEDVPSNVDDPLQSKQQPTTATIAEEEEEEDLPPSLGERLIEVVIDLLFYSGFTIPWTEEVLQVATKEESGTSRINFAIWTSGVGSSIDLPGTERKHEARRITILRLLLVLLSKSIYIPAHLQGKRPNAALKYMTEDLDRSVVLPMLCSFLNTVSKAALSPGWMGGLVPTAIKPGNVRERLSNVTGGDNNDREGSEIYVSLCLQIVNVLLTYQASAAPVKSSAPTSRPGLTSHASTASTDLPRAAEQSQQKPNIFRFYLSRLHRHADFTFLWNGLAGILDKCISTSNNFIPVSIPLPGSSSDSGASTLHAPETLMLLWSALDGNPRFRAFVLDDAYRSSQLLCQLLYFPLVSKDVPAQQGLVRLCTFMLQDVTSEKTFAAHISKPGSYPKGKLPSKYGPFGGEGSGADLLIQSVYHLLGSTKGSLSPLYPPLIISLTNTAASWKNLAVTSSARLAQLLSSLSNPAFLLADEGNPRLLFYLLEALTNVIQYQFTSNPNLVYALVSRARPSLERLSGFTLRKGITEIRRVRRGRASVNSRLAETAAATSRRQSLAQGGPLSPALSLMSPGLVTPTTSGLDSFGAPQDPEKRRIAEQERALEQQAAVTNGMAAASIATETEQEDAMGQAEAGEQSRGSVEGPSDRVRGKMRQMSGDPASPVRSLSVSAEPDALVDNLTEGELYEAASTIGKNGFVATEDWVQSWQRG